MSFGYICPGCNTPINEGEFCTLQHYRHGKLIGEATGRYEDFGGIVGNDSFRRGKGRNSPKEIYISEFELEDSYMYGTRRATPSGGVVYIYPSDLDISKGTPEREVLEEVYKTIEEEEIKSFCLDLMEARDELDSCPLDDTYMEKCDNFDSMESTILYTVLLKKYNDYVLTLPLSNEIQSGIKAFHVACRDKIDVVPFSEPDPDCGFGAPRREYMEEV